MNTKRKKDIGEWMIFGLLGGTLVGILFGNLPIGMIAGLCLGIIIGSISPDNNA
jgi:hypothetical protein